MMPGLTSSTKRGSNGSKTLCMKGIGCRGSWKGGNLLRSPSSTTGLRRFSETPNSGAKMIGRENSETCLGLKV
jgi:hypothetical protein